jgi:hypothetical protein
MNEGYWKSVIEEQKSLAPKPPFVRLVQDWRDLRCTKLDLIIRELQEMRRELREDLERMDAEDLARVVPKDYK